MNIHQWIRDNGITWKDFCIDLSDASMADGNQPIFQNRLNRLRAGHKPKKHELKALMIVTDGEVERFTDDAEAETN